jgi:hypothetical protein
MSVLRGGFLIRDDLYQNQTTQKSSNKMKVNIAKFNLQNNQVTHIQLNVEILNGTTLWMQQYSF